MKRVLGLVTLLLLAAGQGFAQNNDVVDQTDQTDQAPQTDLVDAGVTAAPEPDAEKGDQTLEEGLHDEDAFVVICPIEDEIDEGVSVVVQRAVREAEGAEALLFVINTPGGRVDSAVEITTAIMSVECPTIAFIEGMGAISAGAIISYACDYIYISEGTNIGASTPIAPGQETTEAIDAKFNSVIRGKFRALGEANGHSPLIGEAMVERDIELRGYLTEDGDYFIFKADDALAKKKLGGEKKSGDVLDRILDAVSEGDGEGDITEVLKEVLGAAAGKSDSDDDSESEDVSAGDEAFAQFVDSTELISAKGELLTLTSKEAVHVQLAEAITTDVDDTLREHLLGSVKRLTITPTWEEALFALLTSPTIAGLLLMAGLGGIYVEVRTPGFGAPGIIGTACLALFFGAHMVIGMTDWIDIVLILVGFLLILAEMFLLPGFGIAGLLGFLFLVVGSYMALVKAPIPDPANIWEVVDMQNAIYTLTVAMISFIGFVFVSGMILPYSPMGKALVLSSVVETPVEFAAQAEEALGRRGVALSMLRPAGKGRFDGTKYDVVTRGEFIDEGAAIEIIESSGNRYVVTAIEEKEHHA
jgi:membrane-bound serine protease (ClpP class)